jgi:ABC-type antimicrobial peptide transport system permease subunit
MKDSGQMNLIKRLLLLPTFAVLGPIGSADVFADGFLVVSSIPTEGGEAIVQSRLVKDDIARIRSQVPTLKALIPRRESLLPISTAGGAFDVTVVETTSQMFSFTPRMVNCRIARGRFLTDADLERRANVVVLGAAIAGAVFPQDNCIGKEVTLGDGPFQVVGVMTAGNTSAPSGFDQQVFVPFGTISQIDPQRYDAIDEIWMIVDRKHTDATRDVVESILSRSHSQQEFSIVIEVVPRPRSSRGVDLTRFLIVFFGGACLLFFLIAAVGVTALVVWRIKSQSTSSTKSS